MSQIVQEDKQRGFVTLDSCIRSAIMDIGDSMHRYEQFRHWAIEGYRDFKFDMSLEVKTIQLPLTAWKAIELPVDFVDWAIIGVVINHEIRAFTNDERISLYHADEEPDGDPDAREGDNSLPVTADNSKVWFWPFTSTGEDTGQLYGLTVKDNGQGYFKMNRERREIQFNPSIDGNTQIYLEYIADGFNPCEATVVNVYAAKLIKLYIHWQRLKYSRSATLWQIREAKQDYQNEWDKVQNRLFKITVEDVLECARDAYRLIQSI